MSSYLLESIPLFFLKFSHILKIMGFIFFIQYFQICHERKVFYELAKWHRIYNSLLACLILLSLSMTHPPPSSQSYPFKTLNKEKKSVRISKTICRLSLANMSLLFQDCLQNAPWLSMHCTSQVFQTHSQPWLFSIKLAELPCLIRQNFKIGLHFHHSISPWDS